LPSNPCACNDIFGRNAMSSSVDARP